MGHHLKPTPRPRWHIDYLRAHTNSEEVWYAFGRNRWECRWADCLRRMRGASVPLKGFGSSDCQCGSHLFFFKSRPAKAAFARRLGMFDRDHSPVQVCRLKRRRGEPRCEGSDTISTQPDLRLEGGAKYHAVSFL